MSRRANGEGNIRKRKDGLWETRISIGSDPATGRLLRKSVYGKTQKEVQQKKTAILNALKNGVYIEPKKVTVAAWFEEWVNTYCADTLKPYTVSSYRGIIKNHIVPNIGAMQLQSVRGIHIQKIYIGMKKNGISAKTIKNAGAVMHKAFSVAVKQEFMQANPCDAAELPSAPQKDIKPLTDAEIPLFIEAIRGHRFENCYALCLFAGLREGECLGLSWNQIDFDRQTITIEQQLQRRTEPGKTNEYYIVPFTKSNKPRTVKPPKIAFDYLKQEQRKQIENRLKMGSMWANPENLVFTDEFGKYRPVWAFYKDFKKIVTQIGKPEARPHDLRHTAATVAIASGADVKSVQSMLGHATASFTLNVYAHTSERMMEDTAERMQGYYSGLNFRCENGVSHATPENQRAAKGSSHADGVCCFAAPDRSRCHSSGIRYAGAAALDRSA